MSTYRILFITTAFPPYEFSEALVNAKLAMALKNEGHDIQVIARPATTYYADAWSAAWASLKDQVHYPEIQERSFLNNVLMSVKGLLNYKLPVEGIRWGIDAEKIAYKLSQDKPFDLIMTRMPSLFPHLLGLRLAKSWGIPIISNWNDPTDDIRPLGHPVSAKSSFFFRYISRKAFSEVDMNTFPSEGLYRHFLNTNLKGLSSKVQIIPHIGFYPEFSLNHNPGQVPRVAHAGNMLNNIQLDLLLQSLHSLVKKGIVFEFHVFGVVQEKFLMEIESRGLNKSIFIHDPLAYVEMIQRLAEFDFLMILEAQYPEGILMLSKLSDYASLKKPIIALSPTKGVTADYFSNEKGFHLFDNTNQQQIENGLEKLFLQFPDISQPNHENRLWSEVEPAQIVSQYEGIFNALVTEKNKG
ncbi:glycosyltransferase involved in cell wall biosynthesis [Algoriphagus sp. 4150]|uniref:hypothetical protein n=1 Tax=Algoriphagus sp. 4150 TaxID=2817756 RepID=UPI00286313FB|nr:hypothetical protein [Algoriphagus sp. 4150]MDR7130553.1 glycosyltransferase involved in cell wall biosynthesis [Algoriphagus sp. 4150]